MHTFDHSGDAYDATMCSDEIATGDTLLIEPEGVVGLAWAWPVAVTVSLGHLHGPVEGATAEAIAALAADAKWTREQIAAACAVADTYGFPVADGFRSYLAAE